MFLFRGLAAALLSVSAGAPLFSQDIVPGFEVESVKTVQQDTRTWALRQVNPSHYRSLSNVMQLITWAWKVRDYQVVGAPGWTTQERFEIQATTGQPATLDEERLMLQKLLAERFGLKVHHESREIPVYLLLVGPNGPKMAIADKNGDPKRRGININPGILEAREGGMDNFAEVLTTNLDRPVLNWTYLTESYDFTLTWDVPNERTTNWSPIGAALFPLVRSLGLRLDAASAPVDMLVIDSVERPKER